mgnify:CR=1 FL=1
MDKRQAKKSAQEIEDQSLHKVAEENYIIKTDKIQTDKAFKEAVIYNLVKKLDSLDHLKKKYNEQLDGIKPTHHLSNTTSIFPVSYWIFIDSNWRVE